MKREEAITSSQEKAKKLNALAKELQMKFVAKQRVNPESGFIELLVTFSDEENYPMDEEVEDPIVGYAGDSVIREAEA